MMSAKWLFEITKLNNERKNWLFDMTNLYFVQKKVF